MIKVDTQDIGGDKVEVLTIKDEGFLTASGSDDGYVQSEYRLLDPKRSEGVGLAISVFDQDVIKKGDYSPHSLDKEETKKFIHFLIACYKKM